VSESLPPSAEIGASTLQLRSLEALDWSLLVEALAERASTVAGARACSSDLFAADVGEARELLAELGEVLVLAELGTGPQLGGIEDVSSMLAASVKGEILSGESLLAIGHSLEALARLQRQLQEHVDDTPRLAEISRGIEALPDLAAWLISSFDSRGELSSSTYPELRSLRSRKASLHEQIGSTMDALRGEERFDAALQDDFLAMRNDRYVLPVKVQHRATGLGIVHDASGSGQTVFIEPFEVVGMNNDLKMADSELRREELRILRDLSDRVALLEAEIRRSLSTATRLDVLSAKGKLARELEASVPELREEPMLKLLSARHPVLVLRGLEVVANDISLGAGAGGREGQPRALVLSGPNTGGKTVTLKTVGLAALLARAGMAIPASEGSEMGWFPQVLTDIGDAQDVQDDLSTFSGHILHMSEMLESLRDRVGPGLVLVDEVAAGTDPVQGAALARALLEAFLAHEGLVITTTHYSDVKALSSVDSRFLNARVEFDGEAGQPTYRLSPGLAGSSHAFDVAEKVGLPVDILDAARGFLGADAARVEEVLAGLERDAGKAEREREAAQKDRALASESLEDVRRERDELLRRSRQVESELRAEFEEEVRGYREAVRGALKQMRERDDESSAERARQRIAEGAARVRQTLAAGTPLPESDRIDVAALQAGDRVRVSTLGKDATVVTPAAGRPKISVDVDGLRIEVKTSDLERARSSAPSKKAASKEKKRSANKSGGGGRKARAGHDYEPNPDFETAFRSPTLTLDLRGERVDDALDRVDAFLDERVMRGDAFGFVLHGHGTGALKAAVRKNLRSSSYVRDFAPGNRSQGGDGITVVRLKL
jgi:DNA mismatch repair protein MutS2